MLQTEIPFPTEQRDDLPIVEHAPAIPAGAECRFVMTDTSKVTRKTSEGRTVSGKGIVFNSRSKLMIDDEGKKIFYEVIHPEAVERAMKDDTIWVDFQHKPSQLLGTQYAGTARFNITADGVEYEADAPNTTYANDMLEMIDRGDVRGSSFVFISDERSDVWTPVERTPSGTLIYQRDIHNILKIISMGPVFGEAYQDTSVAKRSLAAWEERQAPTPPEIPITLGHDPRIVAALFG